MLTLCGFFFKLAVFPFHVWAPDVSGRRPSGCGFIATASKIGAVAVLLRLAAASEESGTYLAHVLVALSILSMTVGNLAAIAQKDLKRMFAYSSIAQAGYVLIGILSMSPDGYAAAIFYGLALLVMKFTAFLVLVAVDWRQHRDRRSRRPTAGRRCSPWPSLMSLFLARRHSADDRFHGKVPDLQRRHRARAPAAGPDRDGERGHIPLLLPDGREGRLPARTRTRAATDAGAGRDQCARRRAGPS
jgi:hypothetical protein